MNLKRYSIVNNAMGWFCFLVAAVTYLLTIEPTASFWDCPEFITQGAKLEVGHPPGNPIFMLAARFFVTLFGGSMTMAAVAVNSMSALLSAATILLLFWTITHLVRRLIVRDDATEISLRKLFIIMGSGLCGALAYTWSDTFWFSAVEGEVYAFSSFCTALVFWLILKWENRADDPHSDRYLVLIAYVIGVSIAVHLLNLLCIPAIGLVFYYRKWRNVNAKGSLIALALSCVLVGAILYGLVPGFMNVAQCFELFCVNTLGMGYNMGVLVYAVVLVGVLCWSVSALYKQKSATAIRWSCLLGVILSGLPFIGPWWVGALLVIALFCWLFFLCPKLPVRVLNVAMLSILVIFIGYSSYALLLIRASANTPMNQNAPDNVFSLASYMSREQYGDRPLFYGVAFAEELETVDDGQGNLYVRVDNHGRPRTRVLDGYLRDENGGAYNDAEPVWSKVAKTSPDQPDEYVQESDKPNYRNVPDMKMLFTRIYSTDEQNARHVSGYKGWADYSTPDIDQIPAEMRERWAEAGYAPLYEVAPYLTHQSTITTAMDADGNPVAQTTAWKPGFGVNLRYFVNYQLNHMYWRYFMWNFAGRQNDIQGNGEPQLGNWISGIPFIDNPRLGDQSLLPDEFGKGNKGHNVFYMLPLLLGLIGLLWQALRSFGPDGKRGIEQFWVVFFLFFMTGIAIVLYLNQTPGQPRERDYAFAGSFYAYAIWIGIGVAAVAYLLRDLVARLTKNNVSGGAKWATVGVAVAIGIAVPLQMVSQTWDDHDRSGRYTTRDFGINYLESLDPDAIIFTNGDNDTFPLWYAQEVEGVRCDVRVVNLSYLTTDWYANQLRHPSYEKNAIETFAQPTDYAYDRLAYSFVVPRTDSLVSAEAALREMYASDNRTYGAHLMTSPNIYLEVDTAAALARYGINPADSASRMLRSFDAPHVNMRDLGSGMTLSRTLSLDMIAHSLKNGWKRPVYFASTVPSSYYLGLRPYLSSTGMAYEVTPFRNAADNVNAFKSYENAMTRFRWGGLDQPGAENIYLDETVRRMVASTRSGLFTTAEDLLAFPDEPASEFAVKYAKEHGKPVPATRRDMARNMLDLIVEKLPASVSPWDSMMDVYVASKYYDLWLDTGRADDLEKARKILGDSEERYAQLIRYAASLSPSKLAQIGRTDDYALQYLGMVVGLQNQMDMVEKLAKDPAQAELLAKVRERLPMEYALRVFPLVYVDGYSAADMRRAAGADESTATADLPAVAYEGALLLDAHKAAGIDPLARTGELEKKYGIDRHSWGRVL
ncbi:MAG: DUF2723 domain-containing protein [Muribaculaceae bacterium]|nr:DUF2723 domain-containing protein [Muribaculaceae bacterium]